MQVGGVNGEVYLKKVLVGGSEERNEKVSRVKVSG